MTQADIAERNEPGTGDGLPAELVGLVAGARDALTDDMVVRLSATLAESLDLLDRINRSGIGAALPVLAGMVSSGDLERVAGMVRLAGSAQDALTDDIVGRVAQTAVGGLDLLDRINRSGVVDVLPAVATLVRNGDLERLIGLARLVGSAQDALSDDIIGRMALIAGELMCVVDRLARNRNFTRLLDLIGRDDVLATLVGALEGLADARATVAQETPPKGGLGGLLALARDAETQRNLRFLSVLGGNLRTM